MKKQKITYYTDELHDEFSLTQITPRTIDASYTYIHTSKWKKATCFFWYRLVATPIAYLYTKIKFHHRVRGRDKLKPYRKQGFFLYGNHTQDIADAFIPNMLDVIQRTSVIVHPNNVSMPILGHITPSLGALPLPDDMAAYRNFMQAIDRRIEQGHKIVIYPEAHIWPYYTGIRNFPDTSFQYPIRLGTPAFCFTNTYQKRRWSKKPRIVTYIDGPFYPNADLPPRAQKKDLRDRIHAQMCERARASEVVLIQYIKKEDQHG